MTQKVITDYDDDDDVNNNNNNNNNFVFLAFFLTIHSVFLIVIWTRIQVTDEKVKQIFSNHSVFVFFSLQFLLETLEIEMFPSEKSCSLGRNDVYRCWYAEKDLVILLWERETECGIPKRHSREFIMTLPSLVGLKSFLYADSNMWNL
jgi:hypothetical protein